VATKRPTPRELRRFHRKCARRGVPGDVRQRLISMAKERGQKLKAPDWYAGRQKGGADYA